jgi:hypothetical protein
MLGFSLARREISVGFVTGNTSAGRMGGMDNYHEDVGLDNTSLALPNEIRILWGWMKAPVLGVS